MISILSLLGLWLNTQAELARILGQENSAVAFFVFGFLSDFAALEVLEELLKDNILTYKWCCYLEQLNKCLFEIAASMVMVNDLSLRLVGRRKTFEAELKYQVKLR